MRESISPDGSYEPIVLSSKNMGRRSDNALGQRAMAQPCFVGRRTIPTSTPRPAARTQLQTLDDWSLRRGLNHAFPMARHPNARRFRGRVTLRETACPIYATTAVDCLSDTSPATHRQYLPKQHWPQDRHCRPCPYEEEACLRKQDFWKKVFGKQVFRFLIGNFLTHDDWRSITAIMFIEQKNTEGLY
jgi:hypothetical protein